MTLMEITIVVVILSALMVVALPNMRGLHERNKIIVSARGLASLVRYARSEAITAEREVEIRIDVEGGRYRLDLMKLDDKIMGSWDRREQKREQVEQIQTLPDHIYFLKVETDEDPQGREKIARLVFYPDGSATGASLLLENRTPRKDGKSRYMIVNIARATGFPEVSAPSFANPLEPAAASAQTERKR